jgi:hypothetical protein
MLFYLRTAPLGSRMYAVAPLGSLCRHFGAPLGPLGAHLGASVTHLGGSVTHFG